MADPFAVWAFEAYSRRRYACDVTSADGTTEMRGALLRWYGPRASMYPWRVGADPYRTLVSEVMLQQTQVTRVVPAFERFVARFPDVRALAEAPRAEVIRAWDGLGYNRRAVALSRAARTIVREHGGRVPDDPGVLGSLSGVGTYTAAAVASLAYDRPVAPMDVNVRRVVARAWLGADPRDASSEDVDRAARSILDRDRPSDWNQALMDLGREICRPTPRCAGCPISRRCAWRANPARPSGTPVRRRAKRERFEGSSRQVRGGVLRLLRVRPSTERQLACAIGRSPAEIGRAADALQAEGAVERGEDGRLRLAESGG
jgi:A/G-specific adenine glycosylase